MNKIKRILAFFLCFVMVFLLCGCGEKEAHTGEMYAMGTDVTFVCYGKQGEKGVNAAAAVVKSLDDMLDPEKSYSTVYQMNHANGQSTVISTQIAEMLNTAKQVYDNTGGALDLTIYPLVKMWGFVNNSYYEPAEEDILAGMERLCFDKIALTAYSNTGTYSVIMPAEAEITFAACGRGCASAYAIEAMKKAGVESGIISMRGNIQTLGKNPDGENWAVAMLNPDKPDDAESFIAVLSVGETAVVSCGNYEKNHVQPNGTIYSHIMRPTSGYPVTNSLRSVTIVCEDAILADCLSTAMYVMGSISALNYWRTYGGFDMILVNDAKEIVATSGLIEQITLTNPDYTLRFTE